jgi:hypothetical protein
MKAAVIKIGNWIPGKFDDTSIQQIILKDIENNKEYFLNLNTKYPDRVEYWKPVIREGVVLEVSLQENGKNVDYFKSYSIISDKQVKLV